MECPDCGAAGDGNFCSSCGAALRALACPRCERPMPAGNRFCTECGARMRAIPPGEGGDGPRAGGRAPDPRGAGAPTARSAGGPGAAREADGRPADLGWWVAGGLMVGLVLVLGFTLLSGDDGGPTAGAAPAVQAGGEGGEALGPAPQVDLSQMSPREAADRLYDRVMRALSARDTVEVVNFLPMAIDAYELARPLDADGYFHLSLLQRVGQQFEDALETARTGLEDDPDHLLNLSAAAEASRELGRAEEAEAYYSRMLAVWDREVERDRPEYREHAPLMETLEAEARDFLEGDPSRR